MEDLWRIRRAGIDPKDVADLAEYHRLLKRFRDQEEARHQRNLLFGESRMGSSSAEHDDDQD